MLVPCKHSFYLQLLRTQELALRALLHRALHFNSCISSCSSIIKINLSHFISEHKFRTILFCQKSVMPIATTLPTEMVSRGRLLDLHDINLKWCPFVFKPSPSDHKNQLLPISDIDISCKRVSVQTWAMDFWEGALKIIISAFMFPCLALSQSRHVLSLE